MIKYQRFRGKRGVFSPHHATCSSSASVAGSLRRRRRMTDSRNAIDCQGATENAGLENAGLENTGTSSVRLPDGSTNAKKLRNYHLFNYHYP